MARGGAAPDLLAECVQESRTFKVVCGVGKALVRLNGEAEALEAALSNPDVTSTAIARVLKRRGIDVSDSAVQRHRRQVCHCGD